MQDKKLNSKSLVIITSDMNSGDWLENEIIFHNAHNYENIVIFNTNTDVKNNPKLGKYASIFSLKYGKVELLFAICSCCLSRFFLREVKIISNDDKKNRGKKLQRALVYLAVAKVYAKHLKNKLKELGITKDNQITFYSYWMSVQAETFLFLKRSYRKARFLTRCHGIDCYEERQKENYLEYRQQLIECVDSIICISKHAKEYMDGKYSSAEKTRVSYLGSVPGDYPKDIPDISRKVFKIVTCSSISEVKRVEFVPDILSKIKGVHIIWHHYGDGPKIGELRRKIANLPDNVECEIKGFVEHKDILKLYEQEGYHLFMNVSSSEGIPVSIMEALSLGIPVIATDVGGLKEIIENGVNGYLVSPYAKMQEFVSYIMKIVNMDNEAYRCMQINCKRIWSERFDANKNYSKFANDLVNL